MSEGQGTNTRQGWINLCGIINAGLAESRQIANNIVGIATSAEVGIGIKKETTCIADELESALLGVLDEAKELEGLLRRIAERF